MKMLPIPVLVLVITLCYVIYKRYSKNKQYWKYIMEIPGPKCKPIIGNVLDIAVPTEQLFKRRVEWCEEYYPLYKTLTFNLPVVNIVSPADIEKVLSNKVHDRKGFGYKAVIPWFRDSIFVSNGEKWKRRRRLITPAFHFNILQEFVHIFNKEAVNLVKALEKQCHQPYIEVMDPITEYSMCSITETSMGIVLNEHESAQEYKKAVDDLTEIMIYRIARPWMFIDAIYFLTETYREEKKILKFLHDFSANVIAQRKKTFDKNHNLNPEKKKKALLDLLLTAQSEGADIDDDGIHEEVDTFLAAGYETTATNICHTLMILANEKQIQEDVYNEIMDVLGDDEKLPSYSDLQNLALMERCIKESLRLYPSGPIINRIAGEDLKTESGYTIPKGTNIFIGIYAMHRSHHVWKDPLKFDPDRFLPENIAKRNPYAHIPFSAGARNCIGQKYGVFEIKAALCAVLRKFRLEPVDTPDNMVYKANIVLRPAHDIKVKFVPRK